jgi:signal transduction histidine kinase
MMDGSRDSSHPYHESIQAIHREIARMSDLIQRLLHYGHVGSGEMQTSDCPCEALLAAALRGLKATVDHAHCIVTHDPLPTVRGDPELLTQLFQNLVENSIKYRTDQPPHIHVAAQPHDGGWLFSVRDNGMGLSSQAARHIFEPFRQAHQSSPRRNGVGLGLATCKRIVERHRGRIWVESAPGMGATFFFTLYPPAVTAAPQEVRPPADPVA